MKLYGKEWSRRELEAHMGRIEQIGGVRRFQSTEGPEEGVEQIQVRTGAGLSYSVLPSRGLDIGLAEFGGIPLCWLSPNGEVHPAFFNDHGTAWLRTAAGGLLMTCGLSQVGSPGVDGNEELGLHGRAHHTPARQVCAEGLWEGDEYLMVVRGRLEETSIMGWNLCLTRQIRSYLGKNQIVIHDVLENSGFEPAPHMMLYHFNFGFPLLGPETEIRFPSGRVTPREPELSLEALEKWPPPQAGCRERVYYHEDLSAEADGRATVTVRNPHFPLTDRPLLVRLTWKVNGLPLLVQWKMPGAGMHVLGLEPANCHVEGRAAERERGTLVRLAPGQTVEYDLELSVSEA
ncbi:MAG TPA: aldose 1-epimerase family protein [Anaerolineales bacterium]|nr:aldose 1-epimerase family protein [Anaerolineales bacterium]